MVLGKAKGNLWELTLKRKLEADGIICHRIAGSGACYDDKGDIVTEHFLIECKHHRYTKSNTTIYKWFNKIREQAKMSAKIPVLAVKYNYRGVIFYLPISFCEKVFMVSMDYKTFLEYAQMLDRK